MHLAVMVAVVAVAALVPLPATAEPTCARTEQVLVDGRLEWQCVEWVDGETGGGGGGDGGGGGPVANCVRHGIWNDFCRGEQACYINDPAAIQDLEEVRELGHEISDQPDGAEHLVFVSCKTPDGPEDRIYYWNTEVDQGPSLRDRLLAARGALQLPIVTPRFNPPVQSLVNLETWWWAEGATTEPIRGEPALGVVGIAMPRRMVVSAGGQTVTCDVVVEKSDACRMVFSRAGDYEATMTIGYEIRFEMNGEPIDVAGNEGDLALIEATSSTTIPVREVQSLVTELG